MSAPRPSLFTRGLSSLSQSQSANDPNSPSVSSPAEQRSDAKQNFLKTMRALPTQHYWNVYFDRPPQDKKDQTQSQTQQAPPSSTADSTTAPDGGEGEGGGGGEYQVSLEQLGTQIESVQDFWRYNNNVSVESMRMRESIYLFKSGFRPVWEDRRNMHGGSWTFRVPKAAGPDFWTRVQLLAIGEKLQEALEDGDQICGVGLSVRFNSHLVTIWNRDASKQKSVDGLLETVLAELPPELQPRPDNYFYKKHSDHAGFRAPPEMAAMLESQRKAREILDAKKRAAGIDPSATTTAAAAAAGEGE